MKLRIKGNSIRLRITPTEMMRLMDAGRVEETVHFAGEESARLTYALEHASTIEAIMVRCALPEVVVVIPSDQASRWASSEKVGLYGEVSTYCGVLEVAVEKDFACLDKIGAENEDTFPNPIEGRVC
jgi:hypothetical protein